MNIGPIEAIRHGWENYRERPFGRLVRLFTARIFRGGGDSDTEGLDLGVGLVLTLLAMPGGFVSLLLLNKYASFLQWLRGMTNVDALGETFPDEYFFIVLSMTVTGAAAVWRWDAIFPDRRDYINLVPLPISTRTIFFANLVAILFLAGLIAIDVNAVSCVLFPAVVAATQTKFLFFLKFAAVHALAVLLASVFSFFAVFSVLGMLMAVLPPRTFQRASAYIRGIVVIYLVTLLCSSSFLPSLLHHARGSAPAWTFLLPSCWFLGLCQVLHGRGTAALTELARLVVPGTLAVLLVALGTYAIGYRRHFVRIAESAEAPAVIRTPHRSFLGAVLGAGLRPLWLRTPFQQGCFGFVWKTLLRSEAHRLVLTAVGGLGLVLASQALLTAFADSGSMHEAVLSPDALSVPFILTFLIIVGMRVVFEVPAELRSNWIFQLMLDPDQEECAPLARKMILSAVLPLALVVAFPPYVFLEGIATATLHTLLGVTWTVLLTNLMLIRFRKLPFTCTFPVFKQHSIVILLSFCFGYLIYAVSIPEFEAAALREPVRMLEILPFALVAWYIPRHFARNATEIERKLIFEESATRTIELLRLSE
jgi:hypothetical protein